MKSLAIGIDLGTTNSTVAYVNDAGRPEVIPNSEGNHITPSVIDFSTDPPCVGEQAKESQALGEDDIASFFKRSMGDSNFVLHAGGQDRTPVDLSAILLGTLKRDAEAELGCTIDKAVVTVPAYFNNRQREATIEAGHRAGLDVLRIINEPTAAALSYGLHVAGKVQLVLIYDLGGGTFDVSLARITDDEIAVIATDGDHNLGGKDWDDRIAVHLGQQFADAHGVNPLDDTVSFNDLLVRAESAKKTLSSRDSTRIAIHHEGERETIELTRAKFEELTCDLMERTQRLVEQVMEDAKIDDSKIAWSDLTGVLLVGGSTRMPMVHDYVSKMSGKQPMTGVNVDEAVALGAAIQAGIDLQERTGGKQSEFFLGAPRRIQDVMSHSLGMVTVNEDRSKYVNSIIIPKNGHTPVEEIRPFKLLTRPGDDNKCEVYVTQGESDVPANCAFLGKYDFSGISHDKSGAAILDISYRYDANGVVQVSGIERKTGNSLPLTVRELPDDMSWVELPPKEEKTVPRHVCVYLLIDVSGSMSDGPLREAQDAARAFVKRSDLSHMSIGLISFGSDANVLLETSQNAKKIRKAIDNLKIAGSTNMTAGLVDAHRCLQSNSDMKFIVMLTDGCPDNRRSAEKQAKACHEDGVDIVAIGTGEADREYLRRISSTDEGAVFADFGSLVSTFSTIAEAITEGRGGLRIQ